MVPDFSKFFKIFSRSVLAETKPRSVVDSQGQKLYVEFNRSTFYRFLSGFKLFFPEFSTLTHNFPHLTSIFWQTNKCNRISMSRRFKWYYPRFSTRSKRHDPLEAIMEFNSRKINFKAFLTKFLFRITFLVKTIL